MAQATGTLVLRDLLTERFQSVAQFGLSTVIEVIQRDQETYNRMLTGMFDLLTQTTNDRLRISGGSTATDMVDVDELGTAPSQKVGAGATVGFPLRAKQYNLAWTYRWYDKKSPAEMAEQTLGAQQAHQRGLVRDMKRAVYGATNSTFRDRLVTPQLDLPVKAFQNADGFPVPTGPNGEIFNSATHQHYTAAASLAAADITAAVNNVVEHGFGTRIIIAINVADQVAFSALTPFIAMQPVTIIPTISANQMAQRNLDVGRLNDRQVGLYNGVAEVWIKPWAIAGYAFVFDAGDYRKPLVLRTRSGAAPTLEIMSEFQHYPLSAEYMETEYGFAPWNRLNGAVHQFTNGSYVSPTIT